MIKGAQGKIDVVVSGWPGVTSGAHRFGGTEWRLGGREIGHIHGDELVDIRFPKRLRDELVAAHRAEAHHGRPDSGWVTLRLETDDDLKWAVVLLRSSYEFARQRVAGRTGRPVPRPKTASTAAKTLAEVT
ncbi:MAG: DUF5519 family protein [Acidobacteria bacterium]|nr:DUF5519 family protein [Acidobacteriota bacterium]